ncbi:hypothetical protein [Streptomyces sp. NPDC019224]|uniref:hypothetical protein n=1 Tax=Streptomyces sp. NPDC019224 TaxID=3154484 RepID=UPI0033C7849A
MDACRARGEGRSGAGRGTDGLRRFRLGRRQEGLRSLRRQDDLIVKTDKGERTKALIVIMGEAKWPNCPAPDTRKKLSAGQSEKICKAFLIPEGQKAAAVQLSRGFTKEPLEWPVTG